MAQQSGMQGTPRYLPVPACEMSRLWVKALWFTLLPVHTFRCTS